MGGVERRVNGLTAKFRSHFGIGDLHYRRRLPLVSQPRGRFVSESKPVDFCRGPAELASAVRENRICRLSPELGLHIVELIEGLQYPERFAGRRVIGSTFAPIAPLSFGGLV